MGGDPLAVPAGAPARAADGPPVAPQVTARVVDPQRLAALRDSGVLDDDTTTFQRLTRVAAQVLDVPVALVSFVDADRQVFKGCLGLPEPTATERQTPLSHSFCQYVVATDEPLVITDARTDPVLRHNLALRDLDVVAYLGVPLRDRTGEVLGSFCAIEHRPREWTDAEVALLEDLAAAAMTEIALLRAVDDEHQARRAVLAANRRLRDLSEASLLLSGSLAFTETLDNVVRLLVPAHADWGVIDLIRGDRVERMSLVAAGADLERAIRPLVEQYPPRITDRFGVGAVLRSGVTQVVPAPDDDWIDRVGRDERHRELIRGAGVGSVVMAPLWRGSAVAGVLSLVSATPGRYDQSVVPFIGELARHVSRAVENARRYDERDRVASTLQASLLPVRLAEPSGLEAAARYQAARGGSEVGGDFYDLFAVGDSRWLAVVGDVRGKGVPAAALTGLARHTLRGAFLRDPDPVRALQTLNHALLLDAPDGPDDDPAFCTVVCALIEPAGGGATVTVACGGHAPALLVRAAGGMEHVGATGTVLGVLPEVELRPRTACLGPGDTLVLHTDGVTDARTGSGEFFGEVRLAALLADPPGGAAEAAARVTDAVLAWQDGVARDDIAVLAVGAPRTVAAPHPAPPG